ncbi:MAG: response regulator [Bacteroidota bacterium]
MKETEEKLLSKDSANPVKENIKQISGKILLIDDEKYEKELLKLALLKKNWDVEVEYFMDPEIALEYLKKTKDEIFLIISDMNMPKMSGLDLKKAIDSDETLRKRTIPFIFSSTSEEKTQVVSAYEYRVQGYFKKPLTSDKQAEMLDIIIKYWIICKHPDQGDI